MKTMKVGVLTGGGDAPGLNAAVRAIVYRAADYGIDVLGIKRGWAGLLEADAEPLSAAKVENIASEGGIILYTSRTNPAKMPDGIKKCMENMKKLRLDALIVIGGDDTLGVAEKFCEAGGSVVGVPKTIDNDLSVTDYSIGFHTSVQIAAEAIDRLHTTARSHQRVLVVEVMGRYSGWIALYAGLAAGAHLVLIPEVPFDLKEVYALLRRRRSEGKVYSVVVVAEGAKPTEENSLVAKGAEKDQFGHVQLGGIGQVLEGLIQKETGLEARSVVLGHLQRGGTPSAFDRFLAERLGVEAVELVKKQKWGWIPVVKGTEIVPVKLKEVVAKRKEVSPELYEMTKTFFK
jgi:phosphofructokinase-like protein